MADWTCAKCTAHNNGLLPHCEVCLTRKPNGGRTPACSPTTTETSSPWVCGKCTLKNSNLLPHCEACGAPKGQGVTDTAMTLPERSRPQKPADTKSKTRAKEKKKEPVPDDGKKIKSCGVCLDDKHRSVCWRRPTCGCVGCMECWFRQFVVNLEGSGKLPTCLCRGTLYTSEFQSFLERYTLFQTSRLQSREEKGALVAKVQDLLKKQSKMSFDVNLSVLEKDGVPCPGVDCKMVVFRNSDNISQCVVCTQCKNDHCSLCRSHPYHHIISCGEVARVRAEYTEWVQRGRRGYLQRMAALDDDYKKKLKAYNDARTHHEQEKGRLQSVAQQAARDEAWKAQHCKRCPTCKRVVNKLDGCDLMVCGRNYHGGGNQNGCGAQFKWSQAPPYHQENVEAKQIHFNRMKPETAVHRWTEANGEATMCQLCGNEVKGVKLQCVNCPYFICCAGCEVRALDHRQAPSTHTEKHVFKIFMPPRL